MEKYLKKTIDPSRKYLEAKMFKGLINAKNNDLTALQ